MARDLKICYNHKASTLPRTANLANGTTPAFSWLPCRIPRSKSTTNVAPASDAAFSYPSKDNREFGGLIFAPPPPSSSAHTTRTAGVETVLSAGRPLPLFPVHLQDPSRQRAFKENREDHPTPLRNPEIPSQTPPRSSTAPPATGRRSKDGGTSAWARSPGRSPPPSASSSGARKASYGFLEGSLRCRTEPSSGEEEKHQLRMLNSWLLLWRFTNVRGVADAQVQLLCQWEPHAKRHFEAVATLGRFLGAVYLLLPLVEGAKFIDILELH
ncbi:uncharacterized protein LOC135645734 [Musa acuminata AAA Group]|uniref:uncharacterized protein LOC135645734 n=1 Tax=Musa acuminata AAA Group TaxID=214697 RepID=UPI0031DA5BD6